MKKILTLLALGISISTAFAQKLKDSEVPVAVRNSFQKQYPKATEVQWDRENGNYEASFDLSKVDNSVLLDATGKVLETEVEIEISQLPAGIIDYVKAHYKNMTVKEAAKIADATGVITYEVEIKGMDLIFDRAGKFLIEIKN